MLRKEEEEAWRLELENGLRKIQGKEPLASLDDLDNEAEEEEEENPAEDAMVRETGEVLLDLMGLTRQMAQVEGYTNTGEELN